MISESRNHDLSNSKLHKCDYLLTANCQFGYTVQLMFIRFNEISYYMNSLRLQYGIPTTEFWQNLLLNEFSLLSAPMCKKSHVFHLIRFLFLSVTANTKNDNKCLRSLVFRTQPKKNPANRRDADATKRAWKRCTQNTFHWRGASTIGDRRNDAPGSLESSIGRPCIPCI